MERHGTSNIKVDSFRMSDLTVIVNSTNLMRLRNLATQLFRYNVTLLMKVQIDMLVL